jgi:hypothetical protein
MLFSLLTTARIYAPIDDYERLRSLPANEQDEILRTLCEIYPPGERCQQGYPALSAISATARPVITVESGWIPVQPCQPNPVCKSPLPTSFALQRVAEKN